jgi:hypothetical protein
LIALRAALAHRHRITADVWFLFIEHDLTRAKMLDDVAADRSDGTKTRLPGWRFSEMTGPPDES